MAPPTELDLVSGLNGEGQGLHKQWKYAASQLNDLLSVDGSISGTATVSAAMDLAVQELSAELKNERASWQLFVKFCIDNQADPELVDPQLKSISMVARARILALSTQADDVRRNQPGPGRGQTARVPVKMPPISLPNFDGKRENWTNFWTLFCDLVHNKPELTYSHKFSYLQQCCISDAKELITGFVPDQQGYENAVK